MDTDSLVYHIKTEDFYSDITEDVEAGFDTSGFTEPRPLPMGKNSKVIGLTLFRPGLKVRGALMISGTNEASPLKLCTVIVLHKVYKNRKEILKI